MARPELERPWLLAVWPGMGAVAQVAGTYLVQQLGARPIDRLPASEHFDLRSVTVKNGLLQSATMPENVFYGFQNPAGVPDLVVFVGEQQPSQRGYEFCCDLIDAARQLGVERVLTFAAMATPIDPRADARVFAVASTQELLDDAVGNGAEALAEGEISGLNGVLLAAAATRQLDGLCLLGELPFFATGMPNPKASAAVLRVFAEMSGIAIDMTDIDAQARQVERGLVELLERLQSQTGGLISFGAMPNEATDASLLAQPPDESAEPAHTLTPDAEARIEHLFAVARRDRQKAFELKAELDRHGAFRRYEDRFLDLFRRAE